MDMSNAANACRTTAAHCNIIEHTVTNMCVATH